MYIFRFDKRFIVVYVLTVLIFKLCAEFVIEFEESQHEPGAWREMTRVPGNHHSALLKLYGHADYRFRVSAISEVGRGLPSQATERYKTPASGIYKLSYCFS